MMGLADTLKVQPDQVADRVARMVAQLKEAEREIASLKSKNLLARVEPILGSAQRRVGVLVHRAPRRRRRTGNDLRSLALEVRSRVTDRPAVVCVGGTPDKPAVVIATTEGARHRGLSAGELVRVATAALGGRGGGKDDLAQGGGTNAAGRGGTAGRRPTSSTPSAPEV